MRKTLKKSFALLIVVFMLIGTIPFAAMASTTQVSNLSQLQSALAGAANGDVIDVTSNISLTSALTVSNAVTIKSSNGSSLVRSSSYANYMIVVANGGELTLENITINGNRTSTATADLAKELIVVQTGGTLNFNDGTVLTTNRGNALNNGGGITVAGTLNMNGGSIINLHMHNSSNATVQYGAAITVNGGTVNMYGGLIGGPNTDSGDRNDGRNGAIGVVNGTFNMYGGTISGNIANQQGGGAGGAHISANGTFNMYDGSVSNNNSRRNGGGFYNQGTLNIMGGTISGNTATYTDKDKDPSLFFGAAIYNTGTLNISGGTISGNVAKSCGGGVYNLGTMTMSGGTITGNTSQQFSAGGIFVDGSGSLNLTGGEISGNSAGQYGGAIASTSSNANALVITDCIFNGNTCGSSQCGSDIYITKANTSNVRTSYDYECLHFQLYVDNVGARYSASNAVAATSNVLTAGYGYVYVQSGEGHAFGPWTTVSSPTCTEEGVSQRTCPNCGKVETTTTAALGHNWNNGTITVQPKCTTAGTKLFTCTRCQTTRTESVPALGHDQSNATTTPATCTTAGSTSYTCSRCGQTFSETLPALGHSAETSRVEPTCTAAGSTTTTCTRCGVVLSSSVLPALGHVSGEWEITVYPTKTSTGLKVIRCTRCGATIQSEVIPMIPDATVKAGTTEVASVPANSVKVPVTYVGNEGTWAMGFYVVYDSQLSLKGVLPGDVFETIQASPYDVNPATNARASAALAAAGVSTSGVKCYRFYAENYLVENIQGDGKLCDLVFNVPNTVDYELPVKIVPIEGMTINSNGDDISLLKEDGAIVIPANNNCNHTSFRWETTTPATCTTAGVQSKICNDCGRTLATAAIPAQGHSYGTWTTTIPATCTTAGQKTSTCTRCGAVQYDEIPAQGHQYSEYVETKAATCTEPGTLTATCSRCHNQITDTIPAKGHTPGEWVTTVEPGYQAGERVKYCTVCGVVVETEVLPPYYTPALVGSTEEVEGNQSVDATLTFNNNPGVCSLILYVYYDEALTLNSLTNGVIFNANELTAGNNLRRDPDFRPASISAFNACGVDMAGKKMAIALFDSDDLVNDYTTSGVLLNLNFTAPDVLEGNYAFGVVSNPGEIHNNANVNINVVRTAGEIVVRESVCDHVWSAWATTTSATCTEAGEQSRTCSVCGKVETQVIPATGHNIPNPTVTPATCTTAGFEGGVCANCGQNIGTVIPALGHDWGEWTQVDETTLRRDCSRCDAYELRDFTGEPTLAVIGKTVREGETFTVPYMISGNPGVESLVTFIYFDEALHLDSVAAGDVFTASELTTSSDLNRLPSDSANATRAFSEWGIDSTGKRLACLYFESDSTGNNLGNGLLATLTFTAPQEDGTYFIGVMDLQDSVVNTDEEEVLFAFENSEIVVSACEHIAGNVETVPATCTTAGYTKTYCSICGNVISETIYPATGHNPGEWEVTVPATETTGGHKVRRCTVCGTILEEKDTFPTTAPVIYFEDTTAYAGENFDVVVSLRNNPGLWGVHPYLTYGDNMTVRRITFSNEVFDDCDKGTLNQDPASNEIITRAFNYANESMVGVKTVSLPMTSSEEEDVYNDGTLFTASFKGMPAGDYRVYIVMGADGSFNYAEDTVPVYVEDTIIHVIERPTCEHANTTTVTVEATCTEAGYVRVTCDDCGAVVSNTVIPAPGHSYTTTSETVASCTTAGVKVETCSVCGDVKTTTTSALGHDWGEWIEIDEDTLQSTCSRCGQTQTKPKPKTPTFEVEGKTVEAGETFTIDFTMANNPGIEYAVTFIYFDEALHLDSVTAGTIFTGEELTTSDNLNRLPSDSANATRAFSEWNIDSTGKRVASLVFANDGQGNKTADGLLATLTFTAPATAGTYTVGVMDLQDSVFNYNDEEVVFDFVNAEINVVAHEHDWVLTSTTPATCTVAGSKLYTCSKCGDTKTETIPAPGHVTETVTTPATCTAAGSTVVRCTVCGAIISETAIPAPGHDWGEWITETRSDGIYKVRTCARCGATEEQKISDPVYLLGDVNGNGRIDHRDYKLLSSYVNGDAELEDLVFINSDINNDGRLDHRDLKLLVMYIDQEIGYEDLLDAHGDLD